MCIRNERTPKGDGNFLLIQFCSSKVNISIRNERTPKGDGNFNHINLHLNLHLIRNERTPKGDGNLSI